MPKAELSNKYGLLIFSLLKSRKGKPVCLVCGEHVAVFKEYNLKRHYETKHAEKYKKLTDAERARTSTDLLAKLEK